MEGRSIYWRWTRETHCLFEHRIAAYQLLGRSVVRVEPRVLFHIQFVGDAVLVPVVLRHGDIDACRVIHGESHVVFCQISIHLRLARPLVIFAIAQVSSTALAYAACSTVGAKLVTIEGEVPFRSRISHGLWVILLVFHHQDAIGLTLYSLVGQFTCSGILGEDSISILITLCILEDVLLYALAPILYELGSTFIMEIFLYRLAVNKGDDTLVRIQHIIAMSRLQVEIEPVVGHARAITCFSGQGMTCEVLSLVRYAARHCGCHTYYI